MSNSAGQVYVAFKSGLLNFSNPILEVIGQLTLVFLGIMGLLQLFHLYGINVPFYSKIVNKKGDDRVRLYINEFFNNDYRFLLDYEAERIRLLLVQLGLKTDQFNKLKLKILKLQQLPIDSIDSIKKSLFKICLDQDLVLINQKKWPQKRYKEVNYFVNLSDIMFDANIGKLLGSMMTCLINSNLSLSLLNKIDYIVVSVDGNFLLGLEVAQKLGKPLVKMRHNEKIIEKEYWEGKFKPNSNVIIVHDVLVTGKQIVESINKFPPNVKIHGLFNLVDRKEWDSRNYFIQYGLGDLKIYSILKISDNDIENGVLV